MEDPRDGLPPKLVEFFHWEYPPQRKLAENLLAWGFVYLFKRNETSGSLLGYQAAEKSFFWGEFVEVDYGVFVTRKD